MLRAVADRDLDPAPLLAAAGIAAEIADNPHGRVTIEQMALVTRALWDATDDELFGFGGPVPRGTLALVGLAAIHAADLRGFLTRAEKAVGVLPGVPALRVSFGDEHTRVELDLSSLDDPEHLVSELLIALIHRFASWAIGRRIALTAIELPYPQPPHAMDYDFIFGRVPCFEMPCAAFAFSSELLSAPVVRTEADLTEFLRSAPTIWYETRDYGSTPAARVRSMLERGLSGEWPTADEIAARLTVSAQHLRRLLREEHTSISAIKEEILRDAAIASLVRGGESVDELAARLGFADGSAFRRAFRRWTGSPPGAYRPRG